MAQNDLTTLTAVKQYAQTTGAGGSGDDALISSLITPASQSVITHLNRRAIIAGPRKDVFTGRGGYLLGNSRALRYQPVISVQSLMIDGCLVPPIPPTTAPVGSGWSLDPWDGSLPGSVQFLRLSGYAFTVNTFPNNCTVEYTAGYQNIEEWQVPGSPFHITPQSPQGLLLQDNGVSYANTGAALQAVASAPALGQYVPPNPLAAASPAAYYTFNSGDAGNFVNISYSFCPSAIEMAVRMWVADMYKYRSRIGERSQSQGGVQTSSYIVQDMPDVVKFALRPFENINFLPQ
jgi:hypothetical protein